MEETNTYIGPNGNAVGKTNGNVFILVDKVAKKALLLAWIILPIIYYVFYFKSDVPDLFHILASSEFDFNKCYNVTTIKNNLEEIYVIINDFMSRIPRY